MCLNIKFPRKKKNIPPYLCMRIAISLSYQRNSAHTSKPHWLKDVGTLSTYFEFKEVLSRMLTVSKTDRRTRCLL